MDVMMSDTDEIKARGCIFREGVLEWNYGSFGR